MERYIDATALLDKVERYFGGLPIVVHHDMVEYIKNAPTADVRENVHAHWEGDGQCSNCKGYPLARYMKNPNFCPSCGAQMDEEEPTMEEYMYGQEGSEEDGSL